MPQVYSISACEPYWTPHNGTVELALHNSLGPVDGRPPTNAVAASFNNQPVCQGGTTYIRLGLERYSNGSFDCFRNFIRFPIVDMPASVLTAKLRLSFRPDLSGVTPARNILLQWIDFTGTFPHGAPGVAGTTIPQHNPTVLHSFGVITPVTGNNEFDVTTAYNQAKTAGRVDLWLMLKLEDESDDGGTFRWYTVIDPQNPDILQRPLLLLGSPSSQTKKAGLVTLEITIIEPCVAVRGINLLHIRERTDLSLHAPGDLCQVRRGNNVLIEVRVLDNSVEPPVPYSGTVTLTLEAPDDTVVLANGVMSKVDAGHYQYVYRTQETDPLGVYRGTVTVT